MANNIYITLLLASALSTGYIKEKVASIVVNPVANGTIIIDGHGNDWKTSPQIMGLTDPWNDSAKDLTKFHACKDDENLYFLFEVTDESIYYSHAEGERSVDNSDRVEIFLGKDELMKEYYCLEIAPQGKIMDYKAEYHRKFDYSWQCSSITARTDIGSSGYCVEIAIPLKWLYENGFGADKAEFPIGIYRADYITGDKPVINWYTWQDPLTPSPEFHVPATFGTLIL